jgi:hypothetical protein
LKAKGTSPSLSTLCGILTQTDMIILPTREKYIQDTFFELSFDDKKRADFDPFKKLSSTEQYYLADIYNWDDGVEILNWIIDSEKCDKGTASLIFWRSEPDFYIEKTAETIPSYEKEVFDLLQKIISKFNSNSFKRGRLKFDPSAKTGVIDWTRKYDGWGFIPKELGHQTKGIVPFYLSRLIQNIQMWRHSRRQKKRDVKRLKRKQKNAA